MASRSGSKGGRPAKWGDMEVATLSVDMTVPKWFAEAIRDAATDVGVDVVDWMIDAATRKLGKSPIRPIQETLPLNNP